MPSFQCVFQDPLKIVRVVFQDLLGGLADTQFVEDFVKVSQALHPLINQFPDQRICFAVELRTLLGRHEADRNHVFRNTVLIVFGRIDAGIGKCFEDILLLSASVIEFYAALFQRNDG